MVDIRTPATYRASGDADVSTVSTQVVAANDARRAVVIVNDSDTDIYLAVGGAAEMNKGIRINNAGGVVQFGGSGGLPLTLLAINGIHGGTGTKNVTVQEAE